MANASLYFILCKFSNKIIINIIIIEYIRFRWVCERRVCVGVYVCVLNALAAILSICFGEIYSYFYFYIIIF